MVTLFRNHILLIAPDMLSGYRTRLLVATRISVDRFWSRGYEHSISTGDAGNHNQTARGRATQIQHWSRGEASPHILLLAFQRYDALHEYGRRSPTFLVSYIGD